VRLRFDRGRNGLHQSTNRQREGTNGKILLGTGRIICESYAPPGVAVSFPNAARA
jgi:hypothetical protein